MALTRVQVLQSFTQSPEFQGRVNAVIAAGCYGSCQAKQCGTYTYDCNPNNPNCSVCKLQKVAATVRLISYVAQQCLVLMAPLTVLQVKNVMSTRAAEYQSVALQIVQKQLKLQ